MVFSCVFGEHDALIQTMEDKTKIRKSSHTHIFEESNSHLSARSDIEKYYWLVLSLKAVLLSSTDTPQMYL